MVCSNQKLWLTTKVVALLKSRDYAIRARDETALRTARAKLSQPSEGQTVPMARESTATSLTMVIIWSYPTEISIYGYTAPPI